MDTSREIVHNAAIMFAWGTVVILAVGVTNAYMSAKEQHATTAGPNNLVCTPIATTTLSVSADNVMIPSANVIYAVRAPNAWSAASVTDVMVVEI